MPRQFKLRLRDGTILAVDHAGLRTWLLDDKAMVQPAGSRAWRPLKEVLALEDAAAAAPRPEPAAPPKPKADDGILIIPLKPLDQDKAARTATPAPRAQVPAPPKAKADDGIPIIPLKPLDQDKVPRTPAPAPRPEPAARPRAKADDELPMIPLKLREDDAPVRAVLRVQSPPPRPATPDDEISIIPLKLLDADEVPGHAAPEPAMLEEDELLEELPLVEEDVVEKKDLLKDVELVAQQFIAQVAPVGKALRGVVTGWVGHLARRARTSVADLTRRAAASAAGATVQRDELRPPPPLSELPALRLAPLDREPAAERFYDRKRMSAAASLWGKRAVVITGLVVGIGVAVATGPTWMPWLTQAALAVFSRTGEEARPLAPPMSSQEQRRQWPREVQSAINQLPHLAPETIQLVMSRSEFGVPDPPEVFRRAHAAASRGTSALTEQEAQELRTLRDAALTVLHPVERERVRAYDRLTVGRDLLPAEDGKVLGLFARGVRGLSARRRERLQALLGKAIASAMAPGSRPAEAAPQAAARP